MLIKSTLSGTAKRRKVRQMYRKYLKENSPFENIKIKTVKNHTEGIRKCEIFECKFESAFNNMKVLERLVFIFRKKLFDVYTNECYGTVLSEFDNPKKIKDWVKIYNSTVKRKGFNYVKIPNFQEILEKSWTVYYQDYNKNPILNGRLYSEKEIEHMLSYYTKKPYQKIANKKDRKRNKHYLKQIKQNLDLFDNYVPYRYGGIDYEIY